MLKYLVLSFALILSGGLAWAGTFELSDPADQFFKEKEEQSEGEQMVEPAYPEELRCTVDTGTGACTCVDKVEGLRVEMEAGQCEALVRSVLDRKGAG